VERDGGDFEAGLISGVSVITRGEALGHHLWVDQDFVEATTNGINESKAQSGGIKARFTHPGLSSDGLGTHLGRLKDARTVGDRSIADLHLLPSAHKTPDGDLADYVMNLAEEDPEAFGLSIVFEHDFGEEKRHQAEHTDEDGRFISPDEHNKNNFTHARMSRLRAGDVVDSPAANPQGLFQENQEPAVQAEALLTYALGLSDERPETASFGIDPERASGFVSRFLARHGLSVTKGDAMPQDTATESADAPDETLSEDTQATTDKDTSADKPASGMSRAAFSEALNQYTDRFGSDLGVKWFNADLDFETASSVFDEMNKTIETLQAKVGELQETLSSLDTGEEVPPEFQPGERPNRGGLNRKIRISGKSYDNN